MERLQPNIEALDRELAGLAERYRLPGLSLALAVDQELVFARGYGFADLEQKIQASPDTAYRIASLTKPISAAIAMKQVEAGRLSLNDPLFAHVPDLPERCRKLRPELDRQGIRLLDDFDCEATGLQLRHVITHTAEGTPGDAYRYNGLIFGVLTDVLENVTGQSFADLLRQDILLPLGMTASAVSQGDTSRPQVIATLAKPYKLEADRLVRSEYPKPTLSASAGIVSTVLDYLRFDAAMDRHEIVSAKSKAVMYAQIRLNDGRLSPYGIGHFIQAHEGNVLVWHYGHWPGSFSSLYLKVPERSATLILMGNSDGLSAPFDLGAGDVLKSPFAGAFLDAFPP